MEGAEQQSICLLLLTFQTVVGSSLLYHKAGWVHLQSLSESTVSQLALPVTNVFTLVADLLPYRWKFSRDEIFPYFADETSFAKI